MITFLRSDLYEEIWSEPMTSLARKYGLSDNGLRKVCKAMNIPMPKVGYWAKVAAGQSLAKAPLPDQADRTSYNCYPPEADDTPELAQDRLWCLEQERRESLPENLITVEMEPVRWHQAIVPIRDQYRDEAKKFVAYGAIVEKRKGLAPATWPSKAAEAESKWRYFISRGQLLIDTHKIVPLRATLPTYERALAILNAVASEAEKRGFSVSLTDKARRKQIEVKGHGGEVIVRISERILDEWTTVPAGRGEKPRQEKIRVSSGVLRLYVESYGGGSGEVSDEHEQPLETRLNAVFSRIYRAVVGGRESARKRAEWERQYAIERAAEEEARKRREEEKNRQAEECRRRFRLLREAAAWQHATLIRDYVAHIFAEIGDQAPDELLVWQDWALQTAAEIDPTRARRELREIPSIDGDDEPSSRHHDFREHQVVTAQDYWKRRAIYGGK